MNLQAVGVNKNINLTLYYVLYSIAIDTLVIKLVMDHANLKTKCRLKSTYFERIFVCWLKI